MNPREQEDSAFDKLASTQLRRIERALNSFDPDELEAETSGDVLNITLFVGQPRSSKIVINRHRAARQIWMAAMRRAWHFDPVGSSAETTQWKTTAHGTEEELVQTLQQALTTLLGRPITLKV